MEDEVIEAAVGGEIAEEEVFDVADVAGEAVAD